MENKDGVREFKWPEYIRLRPGMYMGQVNLNGFFEIIKGAFYTYLSAEQSKSVLIELRETRALKFHLMTWTIANLKTIGLH